MIIDSAYFEEYDFFQDEKINREKNEKLVVFACR